MKKFLSFILVLIVILATIILVLNLVEPNHVTITRTITIKAPKEVVFEQLVKFKNWNKWSPFYELDTTATYTYSGTDGAQGSSFSWDSKKPDVGTGTVTNTSVKGTHFDFRLDVIKPYKNTATGSLYADDSAGMTKVVWTLNTPLAFPMNVLQIFPFSNMEKMLGSTFEHGLNKMKKYIESLPAEAISDVEVKEVDFPLHTYQGVRQLVSWSDLMKFFAGTYATLGTELGPKINGPAAGLYFTWDTVMKNTDMAAVFPVSDTSKAVAGTVVIPVGPSKAYMAVEKGGYSQSAKYHAALSKRLAEKGLQQGIVIEEYVAGPHEQPDSTKWVTNIYYLVK